MPDKQWGRRCSRGGRADHSQTWRSAPEAQAENRAQDNRPWHHLNPRWACPNCSSRLYTITDVVDDRPEG